MIDVAQCRPMVEQLQFSGASANAVAQILENRRLANFQSMAVIFATPTVTFSELA